MMPTEVLFAWHFSNKYTEQEEKNARKEVIVTSHRGGAHCAILLVHTSKSTIFVYLTLTNVPHPPRALSVTVAATP